jgi:MFS family permease
MTSMEQMSKVATVPIPEPEKDHTFEDDEEESLEARIERLGRERPPEFPTRWAELAFISSILMSQVMTEYFISGFNVIIPTLIKALNIPQASSVWPASAFSLVIASTLLVFGRLGDMYGGFVIYMFGLSWLTVWSLIAGFSINPLMLDFCRALQGLGSAAYLPTGVMLLGSVYRPGPRKNLVFSLYGACAVIGFFFGIFFSGLVGQFLHWGWYFWIGAAFTALTTIMSYFAIPSDYAEKRKNKVKMDWAGAALIVSGLVLVVFALTDSSHAPNRWRTPYIPTLLVIGVLLLSGAVFVEGWVAEMPLLPPDIFSVKSMTPLIVSLLFNFGVLGVYLLYGTQYLQDIMGATPLQVVAWYVPMVVGGLILSTLGGFILHLLPGRALLIFSGFGWIGASLLLALVPVGGNYWAYIFPAMIFATIGIDITFNIATIFITTQLPRERQGLGGGLINSVLQLGIAVCLGLADIIQSETVPYQGLRRSYKNTFWFGVAAGTASLVLMILFVNIPKAKSDLTADEKKELEREATRDLELQRTATRERRLRQESMKQQQGQEALKDSA